MQQGGNGRHPEALTQLSHSGAPPQPAHLQLEALGGIVDAHCWIHA